ncbi:MAG: hypothetical protein WA792_02525 [Pseudolabrys sp.]
MSYLETMSRDMANLARGHELDTLGYLFKLARLEAEKINRHHRSPTVER